MNLHPGSQRTRKVDIVPVSRMFLEGLEGLHILKIDWIALSHNRIYTSISCLCIAFYIQHCLVRFHELRSCGSFMRIWNLNLRSVSTSFSSIINSKRIKSNNSLSGFLLWGRIKWFSSISRRIQMPSRMEEWNLISDFRALILPINELNNNYSF